MGEFFEVHRDPYNLPISFYLSINRQGGNQIGFGTTFAGLPVFSAHHPSFQDGGAWYSPFINFFKKPLVKKFGKKLGRQLLSTGGDILSDVVAKGPETGMAELGNIAKRRFAEGGANLLNFGADTLRNYQSGSGCIKRARMRKKRRKPGRRKTKKQYKTVRKGRIRKKKRKVKRRKRRKRVTRVIKKSKTKRRRGRKRKALTTVDA